MSTKKIPEDEGKVEGRERPDWHADYRKRIEENMERFEEIKRRIDSDPFGMLFGRRLEELYPRKRRSSSNSDTATADVKVPDSTTSANNPSANEHINKQSSDAGTNQTGTGHFQSSASGRISSVSGAWSGSWKPTNDGYDIDPITMRKVPKEALSPESAGVNTKKDHKDTVDIPVKRFVAAMSKLLSTTPDRDPSAPLKDGVIKRTADEKPVPPRINTIPTSQANGSNQDWLAQEGFGVKCQAAVVADLATESPTGNTVSRRPSIKIESALDRQLRTQNSASEENLPNISKLQYDTKENQTEDVDLLRASDVRAASGLRGRNPKETIKEQQERRKNLAADYENRVQSLEKQFAEEVAGDRRSGKEANDTKITQDVPISNTENIIKANRPVQHAEQNGQVKTRENWLDMVEQSQEDVTGAQAVAENVSKLGSTRETELQKNTTEQGLGAQNKMTQWPEPGEGDMAQNVHKFANRDRWYKQKAPHAMEQSEARVLQAAKDKALICEIRGIYEDTYGTIDTKHRQKSRSAPVENQNELKAQSTVGHEKQPQFRDSTSTLVSNKRSLKADKTAPEEVYNSPNLEGMAMIQRLFEELHETQNLIQAHRIQLENIPTEGESNSLLQSLKASEQRVLQTLKTAWGLLKPGAALPNRRADEGSSRTSAGHTSKSTSGTPQSPPPSNAYRILAYDPYTQKVTNAKTTSLKGSPNEKPLTLSEALSNLTNPAKFVPYFASLNKLGYEIISGGPNILVFKKVGQDESSAASPDDTAAVSKATTLHANPIDGTTTQTGNFASPTGFVNHDAVLPPSASELEQPESPYSGQPSSGEKVRREEPVFSGSSRTRWQDHYDQGPRYGAKLKSRLRRVTRRKRTLRRMVWVGVWTASCCYAVGLVTENLRA